MDSERPHATLTVRAHVPPSLPPGVVTVDVGQAHFVFSMPCGQPEIGNNIVERGWYRVCCGAEKEGDGVGIWP